MEFGMPYLLEMASLEECCRLAQPLGLSFVELNANFPACQADRLDPVQLHALARKYDLYFTLHIEEECDPFTINPLVRTAWLKSVRYSLELAAAMHMPIVNMHFPHGVYITLPDRKAYIYEQYAEEFRAALAAFRDICEEALESTSTRIAIENTNGWQPHEQRAIEYLLESPVFGLTLDIGHAYGVHLADEPFFHRHEERLIHMHGHDAVGKRNHLALGDGEIDLARRFALAEQHSARIVLETKTVEALTESVRRLPKILAGKM